MQNRHSTHITTTRSSTIRNQSIHRFYIYVHASTVVRWIGPFFSPSLGHPQNTINSINWESPVTATSVWGSFFRLMWISCVSDWESRGPISMISMQQDLSTTQLMTLSDDQNEVFKYLALQSLLISGNTVKRFFLSFPTFDFYSVIVYTKAFFTLEKAEILP